MPTLRYHQPTFDLIGRAPIFSSAARRVLDAREQELGFALPASVQEWYSLDGAVDILHAYSNDDRPFDVSELGQWDSDQRGEWTTTPYYDPHLVPFLDENQGVYRLAFKLDGSDDPPVFWLFDKDMWTLHADHFSRWVYLWVWDHTAHFRRHRPRYERHKPPRERYWLFALEPTISAADLEFLRIQLEELPRAYPSSDKHRFQREDQHLTIWRSEHLYKGEISWDLQADTPESLEELVHTVWRCGTLTTTLRSAANYGSASKEAGQAILDRLRQVG